MLSELQNDLQELANPEKAKFLTRFFKTGKGDYGEGDIFLGIVVPNSRKIAQRYQTLPFNDISKLLHSKIHEERLIALLILVLQFGKGDAGKKKEVYDFYLSHTKHINNWDLVDLSADKIVGEYLFTNSNERGMLHKLAKSHELWERRIAMIATYAFIKRGESQEALEIADILLMDKHDLIQKAVGWMLREVGKRVSQDIEEAFLKTRYQSMPRTMLRYAIEHFTEQKRKQYLLGTI